MGIAKTPSRQQGSKSPKPEALTTRRSARLNRHVRSVSPKSARKATHKEATANRIDDPIDGKLASAILVMSPRRAEKTLIQPSQEGILQDEELSTDMPAILMGLLGALLICLAVSVRLQPQSPEYAGDFEAKLVENIPSGEDNALVLSQVTKLIETSPLPSTQDGINELLSRATLKYAFRDSEPNISKCWWLPPPSGSGTATFAFENCIIPESLVLVHLGPIEVRPSKISWWANQKLLGEIKVEGGRQIVPVVKHKQSCIREITIYVTGNGLINGTCTHYIGIIPKIIKETSNNQRTRT